MKCLLKYRWVKLPRSFVPQGKGIMGYWAKLASRAAFRKGQCVYCGYKNEVVAGMWAGGIVGLKSILGVHSRPQALKILDTLERMGFIKYTLDDKTKKLTYQICDWVMKCSGAECMDSSVYTTEGYGFLCLPRVITQRLVKMNYRFESADAWLDLWCHTVFQEPDNVFSAIAPVIQYGDYGAVMTLEKLGQRWGWEKTKVWRFMNKYRDTFSLHRLPGSYGCLIFNRLYPAGKDSQIDYENIQEKITRILINIRILSQNTHSKGTDHERLNHWIAWFSHEMDVPVASADQGKRRGDGFHRVALFNPIIRAYFSQCGNCKMCIYACGKKICSIPLRFRYIRGPCILKMVYIMQIK